MRNQLNPDAPATLLVVDRLDHNRRSIIEALPNDKFKFVEATDGLTAWAHYLNHRPSALLAAADLPGLKATELLHRVRTHSTTAFAFHSTVNDARVAANLMRAGADDFFILPEEVPTIASRLSAILSTHSRGPFRNTIRSIIVGQSRAIERLRAQLLGVAALRIPVLFRGEPGVGSDHAARALADLTLDQPSSLVILRPSLMRLPQKNDSGKIVYLDRIETLSLSEQGQWFTCIRKSERGEIDAPQRVIASTSSDLRQLAVLGRFDTQLADRLLQFAIEIPPLRERPEDISPIARHLAHKVATEMGRPRVIVTPPALKALQGQPWLGNVRELRAVVEKLVAFTVDGRITRESVEQLFLEAPCGVRSMRESRDQQLRDQLVSILDQTGGNLAEAARRMSMSRGAIIYRAQKFGLLAKRVRAGA